MHHLKAGFFRTEELLLGSSLDKTDAFAKWKVDFCTLNTGDLILFEGHGWMQRLIQIQARSSVTHEVCSEVIRKYLHRPFPSRLSLIPRFAMGLARVSTPGETIFCSELVALSLSEMRVIDLSRPANGYTPAHFSYGRQRLKMKGTCEYGEEEELT